MENEASGISSDSAKMDTISAESRRSKKRSDHTKECDDDNDEVEKWARAIIKYHQQTEDLRTRYA